MLIPRERRRDPPPGVIRPLDPLSNALTQISPPAHCNVFPWDLTRLWPRKTRFSDGFSRLRARPGAPGQRLRRARGFRGPPEPSKPSRLASQSRPRRQGARRPTQISARRPSTPSQRSGRSSGRRGLASGRLHFTPSTLSGAVRRVAVVISLEYAPVYCPLSTPTLVPKP